MYNKLTSLEHDKGTYSERAIQNQAFSNYTLNQFNYHKDPIKFATEQPFINYTMGKNSTGLQGSSVDENSTLRNSESTNYKGKITLCTRPYLGIPYMSSLHYSKIIDNDLRYGDHNSKRKTAIGSSEASTNPDERYPMLDEVKSKMVGNVENKEIRNGTQSRDINKQHLNNN